MNDSWRLSQLAQAVRNFVIAGDDLSYRELARLTNEVFPAARPELPLDRPLFVTRDDGRRVRVIVPKKEDK